MDAKMCQLGIFRLNLPEKMHDFYFIGMKFEEVKISGNFLAYKAVKFFF
jgi:hypothetical protein